MDEAEREVLRLLGEAAVKFAKLPGLHPSDRPEFVIAIHAAQNIVLARGALRALDNAKLKNPKSDPRL